MNVLGFFVKLNLSSKDVRPPSPLEDFLHLLFQKLSFFG